MLVTNWYMPVTFTIRETPVVGSTIVLVIVPPVIALTLISTRGLPLASSAAR